MTLVIAGRRLPGALSCFNFKCWEMQVTNRVIILLELQCLKNASNKGSQQYDIWGAQDLFGARQPANVDADDSSRCLASWFEIWADDSSRLRFELIVLGVVFQVSKCHVPGVEDLFGWKQTDNVAVDADDSSRCPSVEMSYSRCRGPFWLETTCYAQVAPKQVCCGRPSAVLNSRHFLKQHLKWNFGHVSISTRNWVFQ